MKKPMRFGKRIIAVMISVMMIVSFCAAPIQSASAAEVCAVSGDYLVSGDYNYKVLDDGKWMIHASVLPMLRWAYYNKIDMNPNGSISDWTEEQRAAYRQTVADLQTSARATHLSVAGVLRLAGFYNISPRWLAGIICTVNNCWRGHDDGMHSSVFDSKVLVYAGFRF